MVTPVPGRNSRCRHMPTSRPVVRHHVQVMQQDDHRSECWCYRARLSIVSMSTVEVVAGRNGHSCRHFVPYAFSAGDMSSQRCACSMGEATCPPLGGTGRSRHPLHSGCQSPASMIKESSKQGFPSFAGHHGAGVLAEVTSVAGGMPLARGVDRRSVLAATTGLGPGGGLHYCLDVGGIEDHYGSVQVRRIDHEGVMSPRRSHP